MNWYKIPGVQPADEHFIKRIKAGGKSICLVNYEGKLYALSAICPHAGGDLSDGWCEHSKIVCPIHRFSYDLATGKGTEGQNDYIESYPIEIKDDGLYIGITGFWEKIKQAFR